MSKKKRPGPDQESVWDYPRPPAVEPVPERLRVSFAGETVADTTEGFRLLETSHPPTYYIPRSDVRNELLRPTKRRSLCEFKGQAVYYDVVVGDRVARDAAWEYPSPSERYRELRGHLCFYPSKMDECLVGAERVRPQEGDFYGGWITDKIVGPFKGGPGTAGW